MYCAGITGVGSFLPEKVMTNADIEKIVETTDEWIVSRTGIKARHIVDTETPVSELCYQAALRALEDAQVKPEEVDLIIIPTITPDYFFPATACIVADRLGAKNAAGYDLSAACSGFLFAVATGSQFIATGMYKTVLVIGGEVMSKILDWEDRGTCVLFGDGAGAVVLQRVEEGYGFLGFDMGVDGSGGKLLHMPAGGSAMPATAETVAQNLHTLKMAGSEVFKFAVRAMGETALKALDRAGIAKEDIDCFIPHQANIRIVDAAVKRLGLNPQKVYLNLERCGNMTAASIPVALDEAYRENKLKYGDIVALVGFGAGLTWGAAILKWSKKEVKV